VSTFVWSFGILFPLLWIAGALLSIGGTYPWWSLETFVLCVYVVYGIVVFGRDEWALAT
jgi:hypothetical protein